MYILVITIIVAVSCFDLMLSVLNYKHRHSKIPKNVSDVYDKHEYKKWLSYSMETFRLNIVNKVFNTLLMLVFLTCNIFPMIYEFSARITNQSIYQTLIFFAVYMSMNYALNIGFDVFKTFVVEEKYGFNKSNWKTYLVDQIKAILLTGFLGGALVYIIQYLYIRFNLQAMIYVWFVLVVLMLLINTLYTKVFIKMFNKLTPIMTGDIYDGINDLSKKLDFEIRSISVMDASRRSSRLNAFFSGYGRFKSIVLYDNLIEKCELDQILGVLAHEIGHGKHKDVIKNVIFSCIQLGFYLTLLTYFLASSSVSQAFGFTGQHFGFSIIIFGVLMEPLGMLLGIPISAMSRSAEFKADRYAGLAGYGKGMIGGLKVLAKENYTNLTPHPLFVKMTYSHPPISSRIKALESFLEK